MEHLQEIRFEADRLIDIFNNMSIKNYSIQRNSFNFDRHNGWGMSLNIYHNRKGTLYSTLTIRADKEGIENLASNRHNRLTNLLWVRSLRVLRTRY